MHHGEDGDVINTRKFRTAAKRDRRRDTAGKDFGYAEICGRQLTQRGDQGITGQLRYSNVSIDWVLFIPVLNLIPFIFSTVMMQMNANHLV
jgi:hypothetical protein